eukprot:GFYU01013313.1.p1 GENE.GFYU01013313.1~~GFYU01013313.1.p1  ORF type:complete len:486 (-),score=89.63 GFYU01013313.1:27-1484(-)
MSNIYINEPFTSGKVLVRTTLGDVDIELWAKEAPKACRNFIQLCMEGYYNGTIFHRIIKSFMIQGGDPTGTGTGGESIWGKGFADEPHSRLRFNRRGLVAMANSGPSTNGSQFFFTLDQCQWLQGKHTIFGKVTGDTIFNVLKMGDIACDSDDRPEHPPSIISTEVLNNPFDDIVPRAAKREREDEPAMTKPKKKLKKNLKLLSFGEEEEAAELDLKSNAVKKMMASSHDLLDDPRLAKGSSGKDRDDSESKNKKSKKNLVDAYGAGDSLVKSGTSRRHEESGDEDDDDAHDPSFDYAMKSKLYAEREKKREKESKRESKASASSAKGGKDSEDESRVGNKDDARKQRQDEIDKLKEEMRKGAESQAKAEAKKKGSALLAERTSKYVRRKDAAVDKRTRQAEIASKLASFTSKLRDGETEVSGHSLKFEKNEERLGGQGAEDYLVLDPLLEDKKSKERGGDSRRDEKKSYHQRRLDKGSKNYDRW